jgi:HD-GYP domain-containing protein (c-di-GMP phosphodiesterase class II)
MEYEDAVSVLREESGKHLDSVVVDAFLAYLTSVQSQGDPPRTVPGRPPQSEVFFPQQLKTGV